MFIKKINKNDKTYYILVIVNAQEDDKKKKFISCFIDEKLALTLNKLGVEIKNKDKE